VGGAPAATKSTLPLGVPSFALAILAGVVLLGLAALAVRLIVVTPDRARAY
jgi:hypothetical protein